MAPQNPVRLSMQQHQAEETEKWNAEIPVEEVLADEQEREAQSLEQMSALELLEGIERDETFIHEQTLKKQVGIESLLQKLQELKEQDDNPVEQRLKRLVSHSLKLHSSHAKVPPQPNYQAMLQTLEQYTTQLVEQELDLQKRESLCDQAASELIESKKQLLSQIDDLLKRLYETEQPHSGDIDWKRVA